MKYDIITDRIEVRNITVNDKPRYVVKATALMANKKDIYEYTKNPDGTYKTLKSIFTPKCIQSIKDQSKHKKLFVDSQHELALNANIKSILKGKVSPEEEKRIDAMLKSKMLPLAKLNDIEIRDDCLEVDTELNPMFREVDEDHQRFFDAVWYSLENKYLNGVSVNFANPKIIKEDGISMIDEIDVLGFSYVDAPAHHENSITEVAIRMSQDTTNQEVDKMEKEKKSLEDEKAKLAEERKKLDEEKEKEEKEKQEKEEKEKKEEIAKQAEEHEKTKKELEEKTEELKKVGDEKKKVEEETKAKGVVGQKDNPNAPKGGEEKGEEFFKENFKKITEKHDETIKIRKEGKIPMVDNSMDGFTELSSLSVKAGNHTADLDKKNAEYIEEHRFLLDKADSDIVLNRQK